MASHLEASPPAYVPRDPSQTAFYRVVADHLETFLVSLDADPDAKGLPAYVERELYDYLQCGILAHGFVRLGCDTCKHEMLLAFSCKRRGVCPSCAGRRMVHTIIHTTIGQYYVNKAVTRGFERANIQPGSVTFIQRFGSAINLNLHCHCV